MHACKGKESPPLHYNQESEVKLKLLPIVASGEMGKRILPNKGDGTMEEVMKKPNLPFNHTCKPRT